MAFDEDTSYLDDAANVPAVPNTIPGESEGEKSAVTYFNWLDNKL